MKYVDLPRALLKDLCGWLSVYDLLKFLVSQPSVNGMTEADREMFIEPWIALLNQLDYAVKDDVTHAVLYYGANNLFFQQSIGRNTSQ